MVNLAKISGLAIVVFLLASAIELAVGSAMDIGELRSGVTYAYLTGVSVLIAFPNRDESHADVSQRAALVSLLGLLVWWLLTGAGKPFDAVAGVAGVWYTSFMRRI